MIKTTTLLIALGTLAVGAAQAQTTVFTDAFTYPDGVLTTVSSGLWANHSGTAGQVDVASGKVNVTGAETEDVNAPIGGQVYTTGTLVATLDFNFSALPTAAGTYFTHFKDATASGFRGRVFAQTTGAAAGSFRLGIANSTAVDVAVPTDLSLNTTYTLTLSLDVATGISSLSINGGAAVTATDAATPLPISTYAFRQSTGEGTLTVDNLAVAFVPEPSTYVMIGFGLVGLAGVQRMRRRAA